MKRFILLCTIALCLGMAGTALAAPFGIFNSSAGLLENLEAAYPAESFVGFNHPGILDQSFYEAAVFASTEATATNGFFSSLASSWPHLAEKQAVAMAAFQLDVNGTLLNFAELVTDIVLYTGSGVTYTPEAGLDALLINGGVLFVSIALPGSGNALDAIFALSANPFGLKATPAPAALWLLGTGLVGIVAARRRVKN